MVRGVVLTYAMLSGVLNPDLRWSLFERHVDQPLAQANTQKS